MAKIFVAANWTHHYKWSLLNPLINQSFQLLRIASCHLKTVRSIETIGRAKPMAYLSIDGQGIWLTLMSNILTVEAPLKPKLRVAVSPALKPTSKYTNKKRKCLYAIWKFILAFIFYHAGQYSFRKWLVWAGWWAPINKFKKKIKKTIIDEYNEESENWQLHQVNSERN